MEQKNLIKNGRQKKFLLVLPLLVVPFITLIFWALGGGTVANAKTAAAKGLNVQLPTAQLKNDSGQNKLSFYQEADKDSLKFKQEQQQDPNYHPDSSSSKTTFGEVPSVGGPRFGSGLSSGPLNNSSAALSRDEELINKKLSDLNNEVNQQSSNHPPTAANTDGVVNSQLDSIMRSLDKEKSTTDPDLQALSNMLDKIKEIQNPQLVRQKLQEESEKNRGQVFAVSAETNINPVSTLESGQLGEYTDEQNGFFSLENNNSNNVQNAIDATVYETQTVTSGSTIKLQLENDIYINGTLIPKGNFVFGIALLNGERLNVTIKSIRLKNSLFPIDMSVYDLDGGDGIYIPGAITRDVAKESADQGIQNIGVTAVDPSLGAQAASASIEAAKTLFSRKIRLVRVTVKAGYHVLLRDNKQQQSGQ